MDRNLSVWSYINYFQSSSQTQKYLRSCYQKAELSDADTKSYDNCYPFMYYLEQGEVYYEQAAISPLSIKPILLFYGFVHLMKACLLTKDPLYPETTTVLAHGLTTRKRKKQNYLFLQDEVKIQKNGLFSYFFEQLFHVKHFPGEKFKMEELLLEIPEIQDTYEYLFNKKAFIPFRSENTLPLDEEVLKHFHMSQSLFKNYLSERLGNRGNWIQDNTLQINNQIDTPPIRLNQKEDLFYLPISRSIANDIPEILIHYALLYNLSMIARYETEWWVELLKNHANEDYPLIRELLLISEQKTPRLILDLLEIKK